VGGVDGSQDVAEGAAGGNHDGAVGVRIWLVCRSLKGSFRSARDDDGFFSHHRPAGEQQSAAEAAASPPHPPSATSRPFPF
jgi:hypothetical protein